MDFTRKQLKSIAESLCKPLRVFFDYKEVGNQMLNDGSFLIDCVKACEGCPEDVDEFLVTTKYITQLLSNNEWKGLSQLTPKGRGLLADFNNPLRRIFAFDEIRKVIQSYNIRRE